MKDINKVVNLNAFICDLKQYYNIDTGYEVAYNTYIEKYKVYTLYYKYECISFLIVDNQYRLYQEWNGYNFDCDTLEQLEKALHNSILELEQNI